jgi:hypothetical protein
VSNHGAVQAGPGISVNILVPIEKLWLGQSRKVVYDRVEILLFQGIKRINLLSCGISSRQELHAIFLFLDAVSCVKTSRRVRSAWRRILQRSDPVGPAQQKNGIANGFAAKLLHRQLTGARTVSETKSKMTSL